MRGVALYLLGPLVLHTFAVFASCQVLYFQVRQDLRGRESWGGWTWRALNIEFCLFYVVYLCSYLLYVFSGKSTGSPLLGVLFICSKVFIGPLLLQLFYVTERGRLRRQWFWKTILGALWVLVCPPAVLFPLHFTGVMPLSPRWIAVLVALDDASVAAAAFFSAAIILITRNGAESRFERRRRVWYMGLAGFVVAVLAVQVVWLPGWLAMLVRFLPLAFQFVTVYYGERLRFFDIFVKRGIFFFVALVTLIVFFGVSRADLINPRIVRLWVAALLLVPLTVAAPWFYARLSGWIDRVWLRRRFLPAEATEYFSDAIHNATTQEELLENAEGSLSHIFQSRACVDLDVPRSAASAGQPAIASLDRELRAVLTSGAISGVIRVLPRNDSVPFLSEDARLLAKLSRVCAAALETLRLRGEKNLHEQREKELELAAARSQLRFLRAQINPHFLFNALGAIAGLIPKDPGKAEETVEHMAEVFRYTLHRADREWVKLEEELEFIRSYLDVEKARFGARLQVEMQVDPAVLSLRVPAMIVQTLVENAMKHGVAAIRGTGIVKIVALPRGSHTVIAVEDNGPGFPEQSGDELRAGSSSGYGLKNVRERLQAHYGENARLRLERNRQHGTTVVSIEFPVASAASAG